jgi:hypothetical protein
MFLGRNPIAVFGFCGDSVLDISWDLLAVSGSSSDSVLGASRDFLTALDGRGVIFWAHFLRRSFSAVLTLRQAKSY